MKKNIVEIDELEIGDCFKKINCSYHDKHTYIIRNKIDHHIFFSVLNTPVEFAIAKYNYYVEKIG